MKSNHGVSDATKRYILLGTVIILGLVVIAAVLTMSFHMELGSVSDLVSGLGAIIAILGIGWQTTIQSNESEKQRRLECRPFSVTMRYWSEPIMSDTVMLYDSIDANSELDEKGDNVRAGEKIKSLLKQYLDIRLGAIHVQMEGDTSIYNVVLKLENEDGSKECIHIPVLRPNVKYIWLTANVLKKIHDNLNADIKTLDKNRRAKSLLFPEELSDACQAQVRFETVCHEKGLVALVKGESAFRLERDEPITYGKDIKEKFEEYEEAEGYSTRRVRVGN